MIISTIVYTAMCYIWLLGIYLSAYIYDFQQLGCIIAFTLLWCEFRGEKLARLHIFKWISLVLSAIFIIVESIYLFAGLESALYWNIHSFVILKMNIVPLLLFASCILLVLHQLFREAVEKNTRMEVLQARERSLASDNAALYRLIQLKNDMVATISHEMRTPLTVMSNYAQLAVKALQRGDYEDESLQRLGAVPDEAKRLSDLSTNLIQAFKQQRSIREKTSLSISELLSYTTDVFKPIMDKKGNRQTLQVAKDLPLVFANTDELMQVLFNLLSNADTHTEKGMITIMAQSDDTYVTVTITDNGEGIPSDLLPHVFEKQSHGETGTGYGLFICREIIEEHGGEIKVQSVLGEGTSVSFTVPVANVDN